MNLREKRDRKGGGKRERERENMARQLDSGNVA
jgi:hypothetical protein